MTRAGFVTVAGKPNAGKSTLLNRMVGHKLSIVSPKPQSTRDRVVGIRSTGNAAAAEGAPASPDSAQGTQMVLLDTPGLLNPTYPLQHAMRSAALGALADADVIVYLADATDGLPPPLATAALLETAPTAPTLTVLNKIDLLSPSARVRLQEEAPDAVLVSASQGDGIDILLERIESLLPEGPFLYPDSDVSTQTVRFFASELIRETALEQLDEEVPYSIACEIEEFREVRTPVYIRSVLYVERESQKRILIGAGGQRLKQIGIVARAKIEQLVGSSVYLDLWVKVLPNWRRSASALARFGYRLPQEPRR